MVEPNYNNHSPRHHSSEPGKPAPTKAGASPTSGTDEAREFVLVKNDQRFVFRCARGEEAQLLAQIAALVRDPSNGLSWFDAATLSQQITQTLGGSLPGFSPDWNHGKKAS